MELNLDLIRRLREGLLLQEKKLPELVTLLKAPPGAADMNSLTVMNYFMLAFDLRFTQVRQLPGAPCLGGAAYTDEEMDALVRGQIDVKHVAQLLVLSRAGGSAPH
jgi:hypothetical protein